MKQEQQEKTKTPKQLIKSYGIQGIDDRTLETLLKVHDPIMKEAIAEYIRRSSINRELTKISASREAYDILKSYFFGLDTEHFYLMTLNRANKVTGVKQIATGGQTGCVADPKVILREAITSKACAIIIAHNHPSGTLRPSEADIRLTNNIKTVCTALELPLLDHIIVAGESFYSFADEGKI